MKSIVTLNTFFSPCKLKQPIADFAVYYNTVRYHKALDNLTPADVYFGRTEEVLSQRQLPKQRTLHDRRTVNLRTGVYAV